MIAGIFHQGSGLGDQLFRYITTRTLALDKKLDFAMMNWSNFKGESFLHLDPKIAWAPQNPKYWSEKDIRIDGIDVRSYDPEINFVEDNTIIDGNFEDEKYWGHRLSEIREWLKVEPLVLPDNRCVIGFRGGEYATVPDLFLPREYWEKGIAMMKEINPDMEFEIHTDDGYSALHFFEDLLKPSEMKIISAIGLNWRSVRYAKFLLIANSAFYIIPSLLNENAEKIIAPRFWARRNLGVWARPSCYYKKFTYI